MASRQRASVQKRQRERKKAEKAAQKREEKEQRRGPAASPDELVATREDLEGYGVVSGEDEEPESPSS